MIYGLLDHLKQRADVIIIEFIEPHEMGETETIPILVQALRHMHPSGVVLVIGGERSWIGTAIEKDATKRKVDSKMAFRGCTDFQRDFEEIQIVGHVGVSRRK